MNRNWLNFLVDAATAVVTLGLVWTGLLIYFVMPPGTGRGKLTLLGWDRHAWGEAHFWVAMVVLALVAVHVVLHWRWVCTMAGRLCSRSSGGPSAMRRQVAGVALVLVLVGVIGGSLFVASALLERHDVRPGAGQHQGGGQHVQMRIGGGD